MLYVVDAFTVPVYNLDDSQPAIVYKPHFEVAYEGVRVLSVTDAGALMATTHFADPGFNLRLQRFEESPETPKDVGNLPGNGQIASLQGGKSLYIRFTDDAVALLDKKGAIIHTAAVRSPRSAVETARGKIYVTMSSGIDVFDGSLHHETHIDLLSARELWVHNNTVYVSQESPAGTAVLWKIEDGLSKPEVVSAGRRSINDVAIGEQGEVYVAESDCGSGFAQITIYRGTKGTGTIGEGLYGTLSIALAGQKVFVAKNPCPATFLKRPAAISVFDLSGHLIRTITSGVSSPRRIRYDADIHESLSS